MNKPTSFVPKSHIRTTNEIVQSCHVISYVREIGINHAHKIIECAFIATVMAASTIYATTTTTISSERILQLQPSRARQLIAIAEQIAILYAHTLIIITKRSGVTCTLVTQNEVMCIPKEQTEVGSFTRPSLAFCIRRGWPTRLCLCSRKIHMNGKRS